MNTIHMNATIMYGNKIEKVYVRTLDRKHTYVLSGKDLKLVKIDTGIPKRINSRQDIVASGEQDG